MTLYYYANGVGPQQKAASYARDWLFMRAADTSKKAGFVYIPTTEDLDLKTVGVAISEIFGGKPVKDLMLDHETLAGETRIILLNDDNMVGDAENCPLATFYPALDELK